MNSSSRAVRTRGRLPILLALLLRVAATDSQGLAQDTVFAANGGIETWQVATIRSVSSAALSPDGRHVAYVLAVPRTLLEHDSGRSWAELWVAPTDGAEPVAYIAGETDVAEIAWSPNGESITFLAKRGEDDHEALWSIRLAGGEARKLLEHETEIEEYSTSPDGNLVAFLAKEKKPQEQEELEERGFNARIYEEDQPFTRVYLFEGDGDPRRIELPGSARTVSFSPNGQQLMVSLTPTPLIDDSYTRIKVKVVDLETNQVTAIENPGKLGAVEWSPDGLHLAMVSAADLNDPAAGRLMLVDVASGQLRDLLPGLDGHVESLAWRDQSHVLYVAAIGTETTIGEVSLDGEKRTLIETGTAIFKGRPSLVGDQVALPGATPAHPDEAYLISGISPGQKATARRLTDSNPWLDDVRLARQEVVAYEARDGLDLEGVLIYPLDYRRGERYPLILVVHGGPESHYSNSWLTGYSTLGQLAAARGFVVFYPNYRGSTGRGVEFSKTSQAAATGPEFDDYVDAVDHLIEAGLVDRDRVGITGASYGGYASAWAATYYSDRFAAAVPFVGISDAISKVGTTDIPQEMYDVHHRKWLWEDWEYFAEASPIYYVKRNRTPTLILHGEDDPRVHPSQSLELYRHLKVLAQAPVRLVLYPGEQHGNQKSASRFDYMLRVLRWMEHYLKGPGGDPPPFTIDYEAELPWAQQTVATDAEGTEGAGDAGGTEVP